MIQRSLTAYLFCLFIFLSLLPAPGSAQRTLPNPVSQYRLRNGLQVVLLEDDSLPLVSVVVGYQVGFINEQPGKTGLAYLLENMMFQGSENVGRMQHVSTIGRIGGELNADTRLDMTLFYETIPSNQLALVLWLESDRMKTLDIGPASLERAKESLIVEFRQRNASEPYFESSFTFDRLLFPFFSYAHPLIGNVEDIKNISLEDVANFYSTYYGPNNAVLCIAGSINKPRAKELIARYFETIPPTKDIPPVETVQFSQREKIDQTLKESLAGAPAFHLGFRIVSPRPVDRAALKVLDYVLLRGTSSRLYKRLYKKERLVYHLSGGIDERKNLQALKIFAIINNELMVPRCLDAIFSEFDKLKSSFVPDSELTKSKNLLKMDTLGHAVTTLDKALLLAQAFISQKSLDRLFSDLEDCLNVTPSDLINLINRHFGRENSILLKVEPK